MDIFTGLPDWAKIEDDNVLFEKWLYKLFENNDDIKDINYAYYCQEWDKILCGFVSKYVPPEICGIVMLYISDELKYFWDDDIDDDNQMQWVSDFNQQYL